MEFRSGWMGREAARGQRSRARMREARIAGDVRGRDRAAPELVARHRGIARTVADVRNALRARDRAARTASDAERRAGKALRQLRAEGVLLQEAAMRCGLSLSVVRRLLRLAQPPGSARPAALSTVSGRAEVSRAKSSQGSSGAGSNRL